jgi:hypothetical protein
VQLQVNRHWRISVSVVQRKAHAIRQSAITVIARVPRLSLLTFSARMQWELFHYETPLRVHFN